MKVKYLDRESEVEQLRMALNMCGLGVDYVQADLIASVLPKVQELKGDFTLRDAEEIEYKHEQKWQKYFNPEK
jgi:hypothetical protein